MVVLESLVNLLVLFMDRNLYVYVVNTTKHVKDGGI